MAKHKYFSTKIRELKAEYKANGSTYKKLARDFGVSPQTLRRWEKSKRYSPPQSFSKSDIKYLDRIYQREIAPVTGNLIRPEFTFSLKEKSLQGKQEKLLLALDKKGIEYNDFFSAYFEKINNIIKRYGSKETITTESVTETKKGLRVRLKMQSFGLKKVTSKIRNFVIPYELSPVWKI